MTNTDTDTETEKPFAPPVENPVEDPPEGLYEPAGRVDLLPGPDAVNDEAAVFFAERGYLAVAGVLTPAEVAASLASLEDLVEGRIEGFNGVQNEAQAGDDPETPAIDRVRKLWFTGDECQRCGMPVDHPLVKRIVAKLMPGREPAIFQTMALLKPPGRGREKPWHQDHAYFKVRLEDRIVGVWIALDHALVENGCMQLIDGGHLGGPLVHFSRRDWQLCDADVMKQASLAAVLAPGDALFFDSLLPHGTPPNRSGRRRRAMQFHYAPADTVKIAMEEHDGIFGSAGKSVYC
ncbi:phytanoyl-CoA dioxygenase family protein [Phycisphaera mikurensis]|uniref:Putative dioxygenase n=1 Tax=Phycisphaera mikurensis (strain NBRC 102666 / KCTC 22515 / FYK2301M01) TaxID=1142394 RepID=I0ICQ1_PHYMF|nr:phytanoyl-CoA dioxygenase family protein [Phycisphaera mikurensis]MBB6442087.1 phytanoyl-CoA hydroxylase [Phycisphaera mikurensis]BAM03039.1 putative dioxygenase [Phycisphaera mikurensis NBRC 102666]